MRVALFTDTFPPEINGVAISTKSLRDVFIKNGHKVLVVTTNPFSNKVTFEDNIIRIPGIELKKIYGYRFAGLYSKEAMKIIRQFRPEIIHIQTDFSIGIFARMVANKLKTPTIYTYHTMYEDYTYYITKGHFDRLSKSIIRSYSKTMILSSDEFITPSEKTKDYMRRIGVDSYINVIPTGIDFSRFNKANLDAGKIKELKEKFNIKDDEFILLSVGRIAKEKSIDFSMKCFAHFVDKHPEIKTKMLIVGKGPDEEILKDLAKKLNKEDKFVFTGPSLPSEVQYYYALGHAFVSASLTETQGLTYMEAMAANLYTLARYDHNLLDVITDNVTGYFFENEEEFSDKLYQAYQMHKKNDNTMLEEALKSIDNYSIDTFYQRILGAYKHAIKKCW